MAAATTVGVPKKPLHLPTNYRTHSGILNAAAAVVDILKEYYPMVSPKVLHPQSIGLCSTRCHNLFRRSNRVEDVFNTGVEEGATSMRL